MTSVEAVSMLGDEDVAAASQKTEEMTVGTAATMDPHDRTASDAPVMTTPRDNGSDGLSSKPKTTGGGRRKDGPTAAVTSNDDAPSSSAAAAAAAAPVATFDKEDDKVDSALLAALRDPRERLGLLKLEEAVVNFMEKQPHDAFIDIGGPYNSIIVSPTLGFIGGPSSTSTTTTASTPTILAPQETVDKSNHRSSHSNSNSNMVNANNSHNRGPTSFQKCLVHRLGDRYNMVRERAYNAEGTYYNNQYIRLCKSSHSRRPPRLLKDIPTEEYFAQDALQNSMQQMTLNSVGRFFGPSAAVEIAEERGLAPPLPPLPPPPTSSSSSSSSMTPAGSSSSLQPLAPTSASTAKDSTSNDDDVPKVPPRSAQSSGGGGGGGGGGSKKGKMVIMKRSSSNVSNGSAGGTTDATKGSKTKNQNGNKNKSSTFCEKEKKYAEARARIFQQEEQVDGGDAANNTSVDVSFDFSQDGFEAPPSQTQPPLSPSPVSAASAASSTAASTVATAAVDVSRSSAKATYRNKQQEETDPDFRRGVGLKTTRGGRGRAVGPTSTKVPGVSVTAAPFTPGVGYIMPATTTTTTTGPMFGAVVATNNTTFSPTAAATAGTAYYYYDSTQQAYYAYNPYAMAAAAAAAATTGQGGASYATNPTYHQQGYNKNNNKSHPRQQSQPPPTREQRKRAPWSVTAAVVTSVEPNNGSSTKTKAEESVVNTKDFPALGSS